MVYFIPLIVSVILIFYETAIKKRRNKRIKQKKRISFNKNITEKFEKLLQNSDSMYKLKERYVRKLGVVNNLKRSENNNLVLSVMICILLFTGVGIFLLSFLFKMWYILLILSFAIIYAQFSFVTLFLNTKLRKVQKQFPTALQIFTDYYISCKNVKISLSNTYSKMPKEIAPTFEKLSRELSSSHNTEEPILNFAKSLDYTWGYAFAELIIISNEGVGDISEDLLFLNQLINEDITAEEETSSELAVNKMMFGIITAVTLIAFVFNNLYNPIGKELYYYTSTGNNIILGWIMVIVVGITVSVIMEHL